MFVKAGETVTVQLYPSLSEFTQVDERGERGVQAGEYKARAWRIECLCTAHTLLDCVRTAGLRTCARARGFSQDASDGPRVASRRNVRNYLGRWRDSGLESAPPNLA